MWREMNGAQLWSFVQTEANPVTVFLYTPTCGNCRVARRLLSESLSDLADLTIIACNLNLAPSLAVTWEIERIPAILQIKKGQLRRKRYDFPSPQALYTWLCESI